jgi:hypothetical protein
MVAMFIIFDFVVHNPLHPETRKNLSYLDIVAAHYARLDLLAQGTIHDAKVAEFTTIARLYVETLARGQVNAASNITSIAGPSIRRGPPDDGLLDVQRSDPLSQYDLEQLSATGNNDGVRSSHLLLLRFLSRNPRYLFLESFPLSIAP